MKNRLLHRKRELLKKFAETLIKDPEIYTDWYIAHEAAIFCTVLDDILGKESRVTIDEE